MTSINYELKPDIKTVRGNWQKRLDNLKDKSVPFKQSAIYLDRWVQGNFKEEGKRVGGWAKLSAGGRWKQTPSGKRKFDPLAKILQDTGRLRSTFTPWATRLNAGIKNDLSYAAKHEYGEGNVPKRRMLPKRKEVIGDIRDIFLRYVKKSMKVK